jgi:hypothetical protein
MSMTDWTPRIGPDADRWTALYEQALAWGGRSGLTAEVGRVLRPLELLAKATERLPAIALLMPGLVPCDGGDDLRRPVVAVGRPLAGELVRLVARALEFHARNVGYLPGEWIAAGVMRAEVTALATAGEPRAIIGQLEDATHAISAAIAATETDLMAVPDHLSTAIGAGLALYASITGEP